MKPVADSCARVDELLLDYAYGELDGASLRKVEEHLSVCPACRVAVARVSDTRRAMAMLAPELAPSAGLDSLFAYAEQAASRAGTSSPPRGRWRWLGAALSAGLFATVILVVSRNHAALELSRPRAPSVAQGGSNPAILGAPAAAAWPSSEVLAKARANHGVDLAEESAKTLGGNGLAAPAARLAAPRRPAMDKSDGPMEAGRADVGGKLELQEGTRAEKKERQRPEPTRPAEGRPTGGPLVRGPEPNRPAEGRATSGPLVRGPEPTRPAEGRATSGPLVRGLEPKSALPEMKGGLGAGALGVTRASDDLALDEQPRDAKAASGGQRYSGEHVPAKVSDRSRYPEAARPSPVGAASSDALVSKHDSGGAKERRVQDFESDRPTSTSARGKDKRVAPAEPMRVAESQPSPPVAESKSSARAQREGGNARAPSQLSANEQRSAGDLLGEAQAAAGRGDHASAVELLRSSLASVRGTAEEPTALLLLAQEQAATGQLQAAVDALAQVLERYPSDARAPQALLTRIHLLEGLQRPGEARADREALLRSYPRSKQARSLMGSKQSDLSTPAASVPEGERDVSKAR